MPTCVTVRRDFVVQPLLEIEDPEFAHWYSLGVWWALYGDEQGHGPYQDMYVIENISRNLSAGRYDRLSSPWFTSVGFYLGMVHGGMLDPATRQLRTCHTFVVLTDPDFTEGYERGRQERQQLTDSTLTFMIHQWALSRVTGHALACGLGILAGNLSHALIPVALLTT